jgi:hypothetical protein
VNTVYGGASPIKEDGYEENSVACVWLFLCSSLHIVGSAAVGGPVKGNENAKQVGSREFCHFYSSRIGSYTQCSFS